MKLLAHYMFYNTDLSGYSFYTPGISNKYFPTREANQIWYFERGLRIKSL